MIKLIRKYLMEKTLTILEAYKAMYKFIREYYYRKSKPDELGLLLSDIQLIHDGKSLDTAMWPDWLDAVESVQSEE
jgi:hypothetical protein